MKLLVLDDEEAVGKLVERIARGVGCTTRAVSSVAAFRDQYAAEMPDVIVLDLQIGDSDGLEELKFLSRAGYQNAIILMSGLDQRVLGAAHRVASGLDLRVEAILAKPVRAAELSACLLQLKAPAHWDPCQSELRDAISNDQLFLEFQPIVASYSGAPFRLEALVRWEHPEHGRVQPDRFIPVAESDPELIDALTFWVITRAAMSFRELTASRCALPIAVNLSGKNLLDPSLPDRIQVTVDRLGVPINAIAFEITETAAFGNPLRTAEILTRLRIKGVDLAIDDFGTGYSSLQALRQLPFTVIKIDRSFVADMTIARDSLAIVKSVVELARNMGLTTVAEGVESQATAETLLDLGADALQGYLISRPIPIECLPAWFNRSADPASWVPSKTSAARTRNGSAGENHQKPRKRASVRRLS